jgi:hypothetical protein
MGRPRSKYEYAIADGDSLPILARRLTAMADEYYEPFAGSDIQVKTGPWFMLIVRRLRGEESKDSD